MCNAQIELVSFNSDPGGGRPTFCRHSFIQFVVIARITVTKYNCLLDVVLINVQKFSSTALVVAVAVQSHLLPPFCLK
jgi:hypothetical protein